MSILNKAGETGKGVSGKSKSNNDIGNIKLQIEHEEEKINEYFTELGRLYYSDSKIDKYDRYSKLCAEIDNRYARINFLKQQINVIKHIKICDNCGAVVADNYTFCGVCGAILPDYKSGKKIIKNDDENITIKENTAF